MVVDEGDTVDATGLVLTEHHINALAAKQMHGCRGNREEFVRLLGSKGIDVVFRENDAGRIYGVTFIDHHNREVYNGSRLGKEFSANNFEKLFNSQGDIPWEDIPKGFSEPFKLNVCY